MKISDKRKKKNYNNSSITIKIFISIKDKTHPIKFQQKKILKDKISAKRLLSITDTQILLSKIKTI